MTGDVQAPPGNADTLEVDIRVQNSELAPHRTGHNLSAGLDHHGISRVYPFIGVRIKIRLAWNTFRNVAGSKGHAASDDPASTFACNVLERADPLLAGIIGRRNVNLDT